MVPRGCPIPKILYKNKKLWLCFTLREVCGMSDKDERAKEIIKKMEEHSIKYGFPMKPKKKKSKKK